MVVDNSEFSSDLISLFKGLAGRITSALPPKWPLPIFEAESYLYRYFIRKLLVILDTLLEKGVSGSDMAALFRTPSSLIELCYLFIGIRFSDLNEDERVRLVSYFLQALHHLRPIDTFCEGNLNKLLNQEDVRILTLGQIMIRTSREQHILSRLSALLYSLSEFIHVGVPQYGREVHGPYTIDAEHFVLVRSYFNLQLIDLWPFLVDLPYHEIEIVETYRGNASWVHFDLTNHMTSSAPLHDYLEKAAIYVKSPEKIELIQNWESLLEIFTRTIDACFKFSEGFKRADWLRYHLEARHLCLKEHASQASLSWKPTVHEYKHLEEPPLFYYDLQGLLHSSFQDIFSQMCSDFKVVTDNVKGLY